MAPNSHKEIQAIVDVEDDYVQPLIKKALETRLQNCSFTSNLQPGSSDQLILQYRSYESLDFEAARASPTTQLINAYVIRKALIRKHFLSNAISTWLTKYPDSFFKKHFKPSVVFELDYAEFLDDALLETYELHQSFQKNEGKEKEDREWWILKPGMGDRGHGIRLFSTQEELQNIFEEWEADAPPSDDEEEAENGDGHNGGIYAKNGKDTIITSHLRHFIAQPYVHPPLLLESSGERKFHIRTYVLAVGALKVYIYKPMLALFAAAKYSAPWDDLDLKAHLTNTCLQETGLLEGSVRKFWDLDDAPSASSSTKLSKGWKQEVFEQICAVTGELFKAAAVGQMVHFQPLPNAFEVFGLDFLVDANHVAWLLEVNAFPDFKQTGNELKDLIGGLFDDVVDVAVKPFFGLEGGEPKGTGSMVEVLDLDLGRK